MTTKPRVLVTTPHGRTGSAAVTELLRLGFPVRGIVRKDDQRAARLRERGVEVVVGSLYDWRDLQRALEGVQRAYHCAPANSQTLHGSMLFAMAAEEAKLEVIALLSGWNPHPSHPSIHTREHWMVNNLYRRMPVDVIHINPGLFAFAYLLGLPMVAHFGVLAGPWGEGLNAPPSNEDIGAVAAGALANPGRYIGRCLRPTGPELISPTDIAATLGKVLGRKVTYRDSPVSMLLKAATAQGFDTFALAQVRHYMAEVAGGTFAAGAPTDHVREVTGREAEDFETIARRYVADPSKITPGLEIGTLWSAIALATRVMLTPVPNLDAWERSQGYPLIEGGMIAHENPDWLRAANAQQLLLQPDPGTQPSGLELVAAG